MGIAAGRAVNPFASEAEWLARKRMQILRDLDDLKTLLERIESAPSTSAEAQGVRLQSVLRQTSGAFGQLRRIEELMEWCQ